MGAIQRVVERAIMTFSTSRAVGGTDLSAPGMGSRFPGRCHVGAPPDEKGVGVMDLSREDLLLMEHALTREAWHTQPVNDLLFRVRRELLSVHNVRTGVEVTPEDFKVTEPKPTGDGWPTLKASGDGGTA